MQQTDAEKRDPEFARFSGMLVLDQRKALIELNGQAAYDAALKRMPPAALDEYESVTPFSWCANTTLMAMTEAMAKETGKSREEITVQMVTRGTEITFSGVWRILMRITTPDAMLRRVATLRRKSCNRGEIIPERLTSGHVLLRLIDWPQMPANNALGMAAGIETIMRLTGRKDPKVKWSRVDGEVHFNVYFDYAGSNIVED